MREEEELPKIFGVSPVRRDGNKLYFTPAAYWIMSDREVAAFVRDKSSGKPMEFLAVIDGYEIFLEDTAHA
jgi:hypothetical protein